MNIFEQASRKALRFSSTKGALTVEQLWTLPLSASNGFDLDTVAKAANQELKLITEESFVAVKVDSNKAVLELKMEIVKHIIAARIKAAEDSQAAAVRSAERRRLIEILGDKKNKETENLSVEELMKRIDQLDSVA